MQTDRAWIIRGDSPHTCSLDAGALSIKCMFNGSVVYETPEGRYRVDDSQYLILNDGQAYTMHKRADVLSVCVFFPSQWASDILGSYIQPDDVLLDHPLQDQPVHFFETLQYHDQLVSPFMSKIRDLPHISSVTYEAPYEEFLRHLLAAMLQTQRNIARQAEILPDARLSTRLELLRRLHIARDYLHASYQDVLTIDQIASVAGLSPYHFIRKFKDLFGSTPHQYLQALRIQQAQHLLRTSDDSITTICYAIGFQSLGSFSSLFHKSTGLSPRQFRKQRRLSK